jgi:hypothetical protein
LSYAILLMLPVIPRTCAGNEATLYGNLEIRSELAWRELDRWRVETGVQVYGGIRCRKLSDPNKAELRRQNIAVVCRAMHRSQTTRFTGTTALRDPLADCLTGIPQESTLLKLSWECPRQRRRNECFPLVRCQRLLSFQMIQHGAPRLVRQRPDWDEIFCCSVVRSRMKLTALPADDQSAGLPDFPVTAGGFLHPSGRPYKSPECRQDL